MENTRICPRCQTALGPDKPASAIYCSARCTDRASENRRRRRKARERRGSITCSVCETDISHLHLRSLYCEACRDSTRTRQLRKEKAVELMGGTCRDCSVEFGTEPGQLHPVAADFHHTDPAEKEGNPSRLAQGSWHTFWAEVQKCELLCANCHRVRHI